MSVRATRLTAVIFVLLAALWGLAEQRWLQPLKWHAGSAEGAFVLDQVFAVSSFAVPLAGFLAVTIRGRRGKTWEVGSRRFVAPVAVRQVGSFAVILGGLAAGLVPIEPIPYDPVDFRTRTEELGFGPVNSLVLAAAVLALAIVLALLNRPTLALTPDGLELRTRWSPLILAWDELLPGGPPPQRNRTAITLYQAGAIPVPHNLPASWLHVDSGFLAHTIRHYVDHPDRRAHIGEDAELAALQESFAATVARPGAQATPPS